MSEESPVLDATQVIRQIDEVLEMLSGEDLQRLHREICNSQIAYIGDSLFAKDQETLDRVNDDA